MKYLNTVVIVLIVVILGWFFMRDEEELDVETKYSSEDFIYKWFKNDNGTLATYIQDGETLDEDLVSGRETLTETMGLWMLYALEKEDRDLFEIIYGQLNDYFLDKDGFLYWKLEENGKARVSTNALIDDIRIAEALLNAADKWNEDKYRSTSGLISEYLSQHNVKNGIFTDYYERNDDYASESVTLSYVDLEGLQLLGESGTLDSAAAEKTMEVLEDVPLDNSFFPKSYNAESEEYRFDDELNMVDQAIVAYHLSRTGQSSEEFLDFISQEMSERGIVHGMYERVSGEPIVEYESPAVYGILTLYLLEIGEENLAEDVFNRMIEFQVDDTDSEYYGGYSITDDDTHIFDNIIPLLAEQRMDQR